MKKIMMTLIFLLMPIIVFASEVDYDISHYYVDAYIKENGDVDVTELLVLKGTFNGYERDIAYQNTKLKTYVEGNIDFSNSAIYNASEIENVKVKAKALDTSIDFSAIYGSFESLTPVESAENAHNKNYVMQAFNGMNRYRMYYSSNGGSVGFLISYTIKDAVVKHEDLGEFYWTFVGSDFEDILRDVIVKVHLPREDNSDDFRVWAHGNIIGEVEKENNSTLIATISKVNPGESVDIRMTMNSNLLGDVKKESKQIALDKILEVEQKRADEANQERAKAKFIYYTVTSIGIGAIVLILVLWIYFYYKYDKEYKSTFIGKYYREFIDEYNVEIVDYLMTHGITENALSASVLNLIYKKNIRVEALNNTDKPNSKKKDYIFYLENRNQVTDAENNLLNFLFEKVGKENQFTTKDLKSYASGTKTYNNFLNSYTAWKQKVLQEAKSYGFFENAHRGKCIGSSVLLLVIAFINSFIGITYSVDSIFPYIALGLSIAFVIYCSVFTKKSQKGIEQYTKWKAFKNFLEDFGSFDTKELPEVKLWDRYMVYATVFGIAKKVSDAMNVKIKEMSIDMASQDYIPSYWDFYIANSIHSAFANSFSSAHTTASREAANSMSSSGSGGGGGFSSGGGFGGGGGGGRGF